MCLPTMPQSGCEHATQCVRLVHANMPRVAPQGGEKEDLVKKTEYAANDSFEDDFILLLNR